MNKRKQRTFLTDQILIRHLVLEHFFFMREASSLVCITELIFIRQKFPVLFIGKFFQAFEVCLNLICLTSAEVKLFSRVENWISLSEGVQEIDSSVSNSTPLSQL